MKFVKSSLKTKITLLFLIAFCGIIFMAVFSYFGRTYENDKHIKSFAQIAFNSAYDRRSQTFDIDEFVSNGFVQVLEQKQITLAINNINKGNEHRQGMRMHVPVKYFFSNANGEKFIVADISGKKHVFSAKNLENNNLSMFILFGLLMLLIIFLYTAIMKNIKPLSTLRDKIKEFSNGKDNIDCKIDGNDEIAEVANEFDAAVKKIYSLRNARQLFLRNIMHEFKSPITRGRLAVSMLEEDNNYKNILDKVFVRQDELLKEFLRIEQLGTGQIKLEKEDFNLQDVLDYSLDILGDNSKNIEVNIKNIKVHVDFELFATALKNLLDNALLYSTNKSAKIEIINNKLVVSNFGEKLEFALEQYKEPFFLQGKKQKESRGLGFGLFISIHLLNLHDMNILYKHEEGQSIFEISGI